MRHTFSADSRCACDRDCRDSGCDLGAGSAASRNGVGDWASRQGGVNDLGRIHWDSGAWHRGR